MIQARSRSTAWRIPVLALTLLLAGAAQAAPDDRTCGQGACSASAGAIDAALLKDAIRAAGSGAQSRAAPGNGASAMSPFPSAQAGGARERRIGAPSEREAFNCALSFGVGGTLGKDGALGARALGQTGLWQGK